MPEINNYSFSNAVFDIQEGTVINDQVPNATITISPLSGYTAVATDFSLDPSFSDNAVQSVVFTQDGSNVLCIVTFNVDFLMPSNNYTIPLCVIGQSEAALITIGGTFVANIGTNITGDPNESVPYANSGALGETELLFTKNYAAASGYYLISTGLQVVTGNQSNYLVTTNPTYDSGSNLTGLSYAVNYTYPSQSITDDALRINQLSAREIYVPTQYINSLSAPKTRLISPVGGIRGRVVVQGELGATYSLTLTSPGRLTQNLAVNVVMDATGRTVYSPVFPDISNEKFVGSSDVIWECLLTGDLNPTFTSENPIIFTQPHELDAYLLPYQGITISMTGISANGITGFGTSTISGPAYSEPDGQYITASWTLSAPTPAAGVDPGFIYPTNETSNFAFVQSERKIYEVASTVSNSSTITVIPSALYTAVSIGDEFSLVDSNGLAPFQYKITNVSGNTLTVTPNISVTAGDDLAIYNNKGNKLEFPSITTTQIDNQTITLDVRAKVEHYGNDNVVFELELDDIIGYAPSVGCSSTVVSGGVGITNVAVELDPTGGIVCFLVDPIGVPDKFEIIHGIVSGTKVATSAMNSFGNSGPFDNGYGTEPNNIIPTVAETLVVVPFIGTNKDPIDTRQTEFNNAHTATGETIPTMQPGGTGVTYKQVLWWDYTAADYTANPVATLRVTGPDGTGWNALRVCFP